VGRRWRLAQNSSNSVRRAFLEAALLKKGAASRLCAARSEGSAPNALGEYLRAGGSAAINQ